MTSYKHKNYIGEQLYNALKEKGVTITQFAQDMGLSRALISKYLNNTKHPTDATLEKIAEYFELPVEYFADSGYLDEDGKIHRSFDIRNMDASDFITERVQVANTNRAFKLNSQILNEYYTNQDSDGKLDLAIEYSDFVDHVIDKRDVDLLADFLTVNEFIEIAKQFDVILSTDRLETILRESDLETIPSNVPKNIVYSSYLAGMLTAADEDTLKKRERNLQLKDLDIYHIFQGHSDLYFALKSLCKDLDIVSQSQKTEDILKEAMILSDLKELKEIVKKKLDESYTQSKKTGNYDKEIKNTLLKMDSHIYSVLYDFILHIQKDDFEGAFHDLNELKFD